MEERPTTQSVEGRPTHVRPRALVTRPSTLRHARRGCPKRDNGVRKARVTKARGRHEKEHCTCPRKCPIACAICGEASRHPRRDAIRPFAASRAILGIERCACVSRHGTLASTRVDGKTSSFQAFNPKAKKPGEACTRYPTKRMPWPTHGRIRWSEAMPSSHRGRLFLLPLLASSSCLLNSKKNIHLLNKVVTHACCDRLGIRPLPHKSNKPKNGMCPCAPFRRHLPYLPVPCFFLAPPRKARTSRNDDKGGWAAVTAMECMRTVKGNARPTTEDVEKGTLDPCSCHVRFHRIFF